MHTIRRLSSCLTILLCSCLLTLAAQAQTSADFELSSGDYRIRIFSQLTPLQINRIHSWELEVLNSSGSVIEVASITVSGGMPDHDHGLPTTPQVTERLANGRYLLEGIRFHMPGRWLLQISIDGPDGESSTDLEFSL